MMNSNEPIIIEHILNTSVENVWNALTNVDEMHQWYFNVSDFKPVVDFEFSFPGQGQKGEQYMHLCRITEVTPLKKLQHSWKYENYAGESLLTWELNPLGNETHVKLIHEGLESFPTDNPDFAKQSFGFGWKEILTNSLRTFLEKHE